MSQNFLNQDFGSEDEDDDFNPAPAEDSDAEDSKVCCVWKKTFCL